LFSDENSCAICSPLWSNKNNNALRWYFYPARFTANNKERAAVKRRVIYETAKKSNNSAWPQKQVEFSLYFRVISARADKLYCLSQVALY